MKEWRPEDVRQRLLDDLSCLFFQTEEAAWRQAHFTVLVTTLPGDDERLGRLARAGGPGSSVVWGDLFFRPDLTASDVLDLIVRDAESTPSGGDRPPGAADSSQPPELNGWQVIDVEAAMQEGRAALERRVLRLIKAGKTHVVLDFSGWLSAEHFSPVIGRLVERVEESGGSILVIASGAAVKVFEITKLDERWAVFATPDAEVSPKPVALAAPDEVPAVERASPPPEAGQVTPRRDGHVTLRIPKWVLVLLGVAAVVGIVYGWSQWTVARDAREVVGRYCNHGAKSRAQYEGCVDHVTREDVSRRYGRIETGRWQDSAAIYAIECAETPGDYTRGYIPGCAH